MAAISGLEVLDEDFNRDRVKIAFNPLAEGSDKRFVVKDASRLKDKNWISDIAEVFKNDFDPFEFAVKYCENNVDIKPNEVNKVIGDDAPDMYFRKVLEQCDQKNNIFGNVFEEATSKENLRENAIPEDVVKMTVNDYDEFLVERRK